VAPEGRRSPIDPVAENEIDLDHKKVHRGVNGEGMYDDAERRSIGLFTDLGILVRIDGVWRRGRRQRS
jgi:hypothetical protein